MKFEARITQKFQKDLKFIKEKHPELLKRLGKLIDEVLAHPFVGTGNPHPYTKFPKCWARKISGKHRLVYIVDEGVVEFFGCLGHYGDH
jgi:Txe/YoeB family toxin of toxin-antitoxin system